MTIYTVTLIDEDGDVKSTHAYTSIPEAQNKMKTLAAKAKEHLIEKHSGKGMYTNKKPFSTVIGNEEYSILIQITAADLDMKFLVRDLKAVTDYLYEDEKRHWEESGQPEDHIFNAVRRLRESL